jgi:hypothetical protein
LNYVQNYIIALIDRNEAISAVQVLTSSKEQFLLVNDSEKNIVMFSCKTNLQFLSFLYVLYVDGILKSAPKFFHQLFKIHGISNGHYVPLEFFLLAKKHQTSYDDVFRHTVSEVAKICVNIFPTVIYADFETAIHNAVTRVWPGCEVKACRVRLVQSWWRKIQTFGLSKQYGKKKDSEVNQFLKNVYGRSLFYHRQKSVTALHCILYQIFRKTNEWNSFVTTC